MTGPSPPPPLLGPQPELAAKLAALRPRIAEAVTDAFFQRHPEWLARYGARGRARGIEDAGFHLDFLAGAVEGQSIAAFENYIRWTTRVLHARGIAPHFVAENLRQIAAALQPQLSDDERAAIATVVAAGCAVCARFGPAAAPHQVADVAAPQALEVAQAVYLQLILQGQRKGALQVAQEAFNTGYPVVDIYTRIFQASLYRVGELWESNKITVADEHMATAITQQIIAQLYGYLPAVPLTRGRIVLTGVQGEIHQVGAMMVADVLEADGWDVRFLGSNMPHAGIVQAIQDHQADILAISATILFNVPQVRALIAEVGDRFGAAAPQIVVGGAAFRDLPADIAALGGARIAAGLGDASSAMQAALDARQTP